MDVWAPLAQINESQSCLTCLPAPSVPGHPFLPGGGSNELLAELGLMQDDLVSDFLARWCIAQWKKTT